MIHKASGKNKFAIASVACICAALIALPAYGFYYVHDKGISDASKGEGTYEIFAIVDETAVGGSVHSDLMFVPAGSTADTVLKEGVIASNNQTGLEAIHNYKTQSIADYLSEKGYMSEISVYPTGGVQPTSFAQGAYSATSKDVKSAYTAASKGDGSTVLDRYDNVVITVTK